MVLGNNWKRKAENFKVDQNQCSHSNVCRLQLAQKTQNEATRTISAELTPSMHKLDGAGSEESKNKIQKTLESIWYNAISRLLAVYECHTKETKKLQEILMTKWRETTRLMQLGGNYFEWKQFGTFVIRSSEGSYSNVSRLQLAQKV